MEDEGMRKTRTYTQAQADWGRMVKVEAKHNWACRLLRYPLTQGQFAGCLLSTQKIKYGLVDLLLLKLEPPGFQQS